MAFQGPFWDGGHAVGVGVAILCKSGAVEWGEEVRVDIDPPREGCHVGCILGKHRGNGYCRWDNG